MPEYDNRNRGVLFKNDKKTEDKHPDYRGSYTNGAGDEFWLSAWIKSAKDGTKFMSLSTTPKEQKKQEEAAHASQDSGEDVPF